MSDRRLLLFAALCSASFAGLRAQDAAEATTIRPVLDDPIVEAVRREGLENSQVMRFLDHLTNTIGHRLTGSRNFELACEWVEGEFAQMGLDVQLEEWGEWPVGWDRGQWQGRVVAPVAMDLQVATQAWTAPTRGRVRGPILRAPSNAEELARVEERLAGAYLLVGSGERRFSGLEDFVKENPIAGWVTSSRGSDEYPNRIRVFGSRPRSVERLPTIPEIVVRADQFSELERMLAGEKEVVVEFDIRNRWREGPVKLHNVVAELKGTEKPEEVVVVCGHLDSWHQATGTTDNGTGTTTTLEAARILTAAGAKPKRTIRFCLWGGEEQGLLGSRQHVQRRRTDMSNVSIVLNHDTGTNWAQNLTVNAANYEAMQRVMAPVMELTPPDPDWQGPVFDLRQAERVSGGGGSDHASFIAARVPAFAWGLVGRSDYFGYTWHSQWDTYDVAIPEYQRHTATVIALTALGVANLPEKLSSEGVEPRSRREPLRVEDLMARSFAAKFGGENKLVLSEIQADGRAAKIGLQDGDKLVAVDGEKLESLSAFRLALRNIEGEKVKLTIERDGKYVDLEVERSAIRSQRRRRR